MANNIDPQKLFEFLMARDKRHRESLSFTYRQIGEAAYKGAEVGEYDKGSVREYEARSNEIDVLIKEMQRMAREAQSDL